MNKDFKVGDLVHRVAKVHPHLSLDGMDIGRHYVVTGAQRGLIQVDGAKGWWQSSYFKPSERTAVLPAAALDVQHGGSHYKKLAIQPVEYIMANKIPYMEGNVIKYITRWKDKGGVQDLNKAKHYIELLIENEEKNAKAAK
ncbi:MAG: DUF3310 domain-containing protein [Aurantimicrobium sp.]|uniref:DUF3310 domain-containing protein n=1 Tax=Aurantimicrobium sp. TaxID=1930784 RepID=UPI002FCB7279